MILVYVLLLSLAVGYARGGRLRRYDQRPLRAIALPVAAFLIEALLARLGQDLLLPAVLAEYALLLLFLFFNRREKAMWLLLAGTLVNFFVILCHGGRMPVSPAIYRYEVFAPFVERVQSGELLEYVLVGWDDPLWWLGDAVPIPVLVPGLASVGDFLLGGGLFWLVQRIMCPSAPRGD